MIDAVRPPGAIQDPVTEDAGAVAPDAGPSATAPDAGPADPTVDSGTDGAPVGPSDAGPDAPAADVNVCPAGDLPKNAVASTDCEVSSFGSPGCSPCFPYAYVCESASVAFSFPASVPAANATQGGAVGTVRIVCLNVQTCVQADSSASQCPGAHAYSCPAANGASLAPLPDPACTAASSGIWCCP